MKKFASLVVALGLAVGSGGVAHAATVYPYPAGGTWEYGNGKVKAYSHYYHKTKAHKSSLYKKGVLEAGNICVVRGTWSPGDKWHAPWTGGYAYYYNFC